MGNGASAGKDGVSRSSSFRTTYHCFSEKDKAELEKLFQDLAPDGRGLVPKAKVLEHLPYAMSVSPLVAPVLDVVIKRRLRTVGDESEESTATASLVDFLTFLSLFSTNELPARKIEALFEAFDADDDGFLDKDDLVRMWKRLLGPAFTDAQLLARATALLGQTDVEAINKVSIQQFATMVSGTDLMAYMTTLY